MKDVDDFGLPLIVKPFRPLTGGWEPVEVAWPRDRRQRYVIEKYYNRGQELQVITAIEMVEPDDLVVRPRRAEFHVSVSGLKWMAPAPYRVSDSRARWAMKQFGYAGYTEDNHVPGGIARNYWRPVDDHFQGEVCKCLEREPTMREMKGDYVWRG
ncbi:MAG TPA: hypothetical protein VE907_06345 [Gammaproteobacteria bacterium]|nr:hypothetical protein [Gammaproteobacteria bacterium]